MQTYQDRVRQEHLELEEKLSKLKHFIQFNPTYKELDQAERDRLFHQSIHMERYNQILIECIKAFTPPMEP